MMKHMRNTILIALAALFVTACATQVIPKELEGQVDKNVSFLQVKQAPNQYQNRTIVLGGEILSIKREGDGARIEILQLPLDRDLEPTTDRTKSLGRFLGVEHQPLDPATLPVGTRVTVIGDVAGTTTLPMGEDQYTYPTLVVKHIKPWEPAAPARRGGTGVGIGIGGGVFGGHGGGFGGIGIGGGY